MTDTEARDHVFRMTGKDTSSARFRRVPGGPLIVENVFPSRPVSLLDLTFYSAKGVLPDLRVVPVDKDYGLFPRCSALRLVDPREMFAQRAPHANYRFTYDEAVGIKHAYWEGDAGMRELARQHQVDVKDIYRLVHSMTYWYAW